LRSWHSLSWARNYPSFIERSSYQSLRTLQYFSAFNNIIFSYWGVVGPSPPETSNRKTTSCSALLD
jgi:hypothetical protein